MASQHNFFFFAAISNNVYPGKSFHHRDASPEVGLVSAPGDYLKIIIIKIHCVKVTHPLLC